MQITDIKIDDFDYPLPDELIARHPLTQRDACRLLVRENDGTLQHRLFSDLPRLLPSDSIMVCNNTRVINARLRFHKPGASGALIEIFCLEPEEPRDYERSFAATGSCSWLCFVGNSKRWKEGPLTLDLKVDGKDVRLSAVRAERRDNASVVQFSWDDNSVTFSKIIDAAGEIPIPPYLNRATEQSDTTDYQTVFNRIEGSVAAPTAGLHFTPRVLDEIDTLGIPRRELTLHVGAGTFQPVKSDTIGDHTMHSEFICVDRALIEELAATYRKVIAVGTTSVRTLESLYHLGCMVIRGEKPCEVPQWYPYTDHGQDIPTPDALRALAGYLSENGLDCLVASTRIIIAPGYRYRVIRGMVTNFHQPKSTLLLLVSAFTGGDWQRMYREALEQRYRFLSYGDAQLLL